MANDREIWKVAGKDKCSREYQELAGKYEKWDKKLNVQRNNAGDRKLWRLRKRCEMSG